MLQFQFTLSRSVTMNYRTLYKNGNNNILSNGTCSWSWVVWFLLLSYESSLGLLFFILLHTDFDLAFIK